MSENNDFSQKLPIVMMDKRSGTIYLITLYVQAINGNLTLASKWSSTRPGSKASADVLKEFTESLPAILEKTCGIVLEGSPEVSEWMDEEELEKCMRRDSGGGIG